MSSIAVVLNYADVDKDMYCRLHCVRFERIGADQRYG